METIYEARAGVNGVNRCVSANSAAGGARRGLDVFGSAQEAKLGIPVHSARVASEIEPGRLQSEAAPLRLGKVAPYQNMSLRANRIWREVVAVPVMTPAEGLMLFPVKTTAFGSAKFE